jgi:hypothetical protein
MRTRVFTCAQKERHTPYLKAHAISVAVPRKRPNPAQNDKTGDPFVFVGKLCGKIFSSRICLGHDGPNGVTGPLAAVPAGGDRAGVRLHVRGRAAAAARAAGREKARAAGLVGLANI